MNKERRAILNNVLGRLAKCRTAGNIDMKALEEASGSTISAT